MCTKVKIFRQNSSRVVEKDFSLGINKCCENADRHKKDRVVKIFSEMGDIRIEI